MATCYRLKSTVKKCDGAVAIEGFCFFFTSLGLLVPVCLPILCRLWERARRWDRCLCSPPSDWAGWQGVAYAVRRQLYQETAGHGGGELMRGKWKPLAQFYNWNRTQITFKFSGHKELVSLPSVYHNLQQSYGLEALINMYEQNNQHRVENFKTLARPL